MLGAATHIVWDGFTHGNGPFVLQWSGLEAKAFGFSAYKVLQHGGTLAGFAIMALWFHTRPRIRCLDARESDGWYWPVAAVSFLVMLILLQQIRPGIGLTNLVLQSIDGLFLALLGAGCWSHFKFTFSRN